MEIIVTEMRDMYVVGTANKTNRNLTDGASLNVFGWDAGGAIQTAESAIRNKISDGKDWINVDLANQINNLNSRQIIDNNGNIINQSLTDRISNSSEYVFFNDVIQKNTPG